MNRTCRLRCSLLAISLVAAVSAVPVHGSVLTWKLELDRPVRWFKTSPPGVFLVGTDREIVGVSSDSGKVLWRIGPIKNSKTDDVELLAHPTAALLSAGMRDASGIPPVSLIDLRNGHILWTCQQASVLRSIGSFLVPGTDKLLVRAALTPNGSKKTAMLVDLASGLPIWTNEAFGNDFEPVLPFWFKSCLVRAHQAPFIDSDSSMIFHMRDGMFQRVNLTTGALAWTAKGDNVTPYTSASDVEHTTMKVAGRTSYNPETQRVEYDEEAEEDEDREMAFQFAPMLRSSRGDRFYAPYQESVAAFSLASGQRLWSDPPELHGAVEQMEETPKGLLVRTVEPSGKEDHRRILLLDAETGAVRWRWPKKGGALSLGSGYWTDASNFLLEGDRVVIAAEGKLRTADLAEGREQTLAKLKFRHDDGARTLLRGPDGYVVIGRSDLGIYAKADGQCTKKYSCEPPDDFGLGLALLALSAVSKGWVSPKIGLEAWNNDYSASEERESYAYFLANLRWKGGREPGIVRVRRETGEVAGWLYVGTKTPNFVLDSDGQIYIKSGPNSIQCARF